MRIHRTVVATALLALLAVAAVAVAGAFSPGTPQARATDPVVLTVSGNGQTKTFTMTELQALPTYSGYFGIKNSAGSITPPAPITGVRLTDVLTAAGMTMTTLNACDVTAPDDFGATFTYDQVINGNGIQLYNADTKAKEEPKAPLAIVIAYAQNGVPIPPAPSGEGPLRQVIAQETNVNQVADGHLLVKWVSNVRLRGAVAEWKVKMYGLKRKNGTRQTYTLDRGSFDSCATPGCHGHSWVSPTTHKTWSGVPLFLCIGKVDGGPGHDSYNAYNEALALKGYRIKLVSTSGRYAILGSRTIRDKTSIILANKLMGSDLVARYYPLKLVGPVRYVPTRSSIGQLSKIYLLPK
jgi:hypothetical protein